MATGADVPAPARVSEIAAMLPERPAGFGQPASERAPWDRLAKNRNFAGCVSRAEKLSGEPIPTLTDDLYLDYSQTGNRDRCQKVLGARDSRLAALALAECLEYRGRFLKPLCEIVESICSEKTWVLPAHDRKLENFHGQAKEPDLRACTIAWELAEVDFLLGDRLPPQTRQRLRESVDERVLSPFREMIEGRRKETFWIRATHNWNAVCLAGVTGAALAIKETRADRAFYVAAAERHIRSFLSGFTPDGYCSEGLGYWNYGFGRFLMLSEMVRQATRGRIDLLADPAALEPALYAKRSEILNGVYPSIADCGPGTRPGEQLLRFISERFRLGLPEERTVDWVEPGTAVSTAMYCFLEKPLPAIPRAKPAAVGSDLRSWFKDGGVLICRPGLSNASFAAALKGGHNAEHHNHNDVGSFSVVMGHTMVLCDPGAEVYTARTFGSRRYESKVLNSYGHAVPVIAGKLQSPGAQARAVVDRAQFDAAQDTLALNIRSAYDVPGLEQLERTFVFRRGAKPSLSVRDEVALKERGTFESALITWGKLEQLPDGRLLVRDGEDAVVVTVDAGGAACSVGTETINEDVHTRRKPVRIAITLKEPVQKAVVTLKIEPAS